MGPAQAPSFRGDCMSVAIAFVLLIAGTLNSNSEVIERLRGRGRIEDELGQARAQGYYETLIDASRPRPRGKGLSGREEEVPPPPGWRTFADSGVVEEVHRYDRWRLRANQETTWNGTMLRINRLGFRGPQVSREKPAGTYRIVVLGSSNTMGHGVEDEQIYIRLLEHWLDQATGPERRVEVLNLSVSSDSPTQRLWRLQNQVEALNPDLILCDATALDFSLEELHLHAIVKRGVPIPYPFVQEALRRAGVSSSDTADEFGGKLREMTLELMERTYAGWSQEARRLGLPILVVVLPRADQKVENPYIFRKIRQVAGSHGMDCLDLTNAFDSLEVDAFRIAPWDKHPSPLGHRVLFEALRDRILERGGLPNLPISGSQGRDPSASSG